MTLKVTGAGTRESPFLVPLPTYQIRHVDWATMLAIVEVPDTDMPPDPQDAAIIQAPEFEKARIPKNRLDGAFEAWTRHIDRRYEQVAGKFRLRGL